jgi:hypothetical protein
MMWQGCCLLHLNSRFNISATRCQYKLVEDEISQREHQQANITLFSFLAGDSVMWTIGPHLSS